MASPAPRSFGVTSLVLTLLGAVAAAVGLFALRWTKSDEGGQQLLPDDPKFLDLRRVLRLFEDAAIPDKPSWTIAYFSYGAFVLLGVTLVVALLAALPTPAAGALRVIGFVVGLVSAAAAVFVPALDDGGGLSEYLSGGLGLYFVAGGSLLMAIGALSGSRRRV